MSKPFPVSYIASHQKRLSWLDGQTDLFRVIDGEGDGYPNVYVDQMGDVILVSTMDEAVPQSLLQEWQSMGCAVFHKTLEQDVKRPPTQILGPNIDPVFEAKEQGVKFKIDLNAGYSQGIFLDQRLHRQKVRDLLKPGDTLLNTFAYTGAFSVYGALAGAQTTTLDLAQPCLDWAKENMVLNGIDPNTQYFCKGDTLHWLKRFEKQGRRFNGIVLDPPTFSRDDKGNVFRVERDYGKLVALASRCLAPKGWILCTCNCKKLSHAAFKSMVREGMPFASLSSDPMPPEFTGDDYLKRVWAVSRA